MELLIKFEQKEDYLEFIRIVKEGIVENPEDMSYDEANNIINVIKLNK